MNSNELKCPICGKPTRVYMGNARKDKLCGEHADLLKREVIGLNEKNQYIDLKTKKLLVEDDKPKSKYSFKSDNKTSNASLKVEENIKSLSEKDKDNEVKCIACGCNTKPGFLFCPICYEKYKNKELLVKITKCTGVEILDDSYEGHYVCDDGHIVKSKSERDIDNYLFEKNIPHAYEKKFFIDEKTEETINPDFTLPKFRDGEDVIIEHWGFNENNKEYTKSKKYKIDIYKRKKTTLICTNEKDMQDYKIALERKLKTFETGKINFDK